jgi:heterodisulfide reductase subunit A-like polyferredoxin
MSGSPPKSTGAALVVGGGVAGIQCSLDLAEGGYKVHLVEKAPALGGHMAQLDKTFPTNDCSMCTLAPKLVEAGRHLNIDIITNSELTGLEGEPGNFSATVYHHARFVDPDVCTSCGECVPVCPITVADRYNEGLGDRKAIYKLYTQAIPSTYVVDKKGYAPCKSNCPVETSAQGYIALIAEGRFEEAYRVAAEPNPFPSVCGRICAHPCETACTRGSVDEAISIASLKRFACDHGAPDDLPEQLPVVFDEKVAIIGGGPAGLSCARDLAQYGYATTVFEALPVAGGMLRVGIPDHRMPPDVLQREIDQVCALGVDLRLNQRCGVDFTVDGLLADGYKAVFLAPGLHASAPAPAKGDDLDGCLKAVEFLRELNLGRPMPVGDRVVVIGGGDVAFDTARGASRLTSTSGKAPEVTIAYRRSSEEMPASREEIEEGLDEQVRIEYLVAPVEIIGTGGKVSAIRLQRCRLGEPDEKGRRRPEPIEGDYVEIPCDTVIFAIGQALVDDFAKALDDLDIEWNAVKVDGDTLATAHPGVFAGGDVAPIGPLTAIEAIAAGRKGAASIHNYLRGEELVSLWTNSLDEARPDDEVLAKLTPEPRVEMPEHPGADRRRSWVEVRQGYTEEQAVAEAKRCLQCAVCSECMECVRACGPGALRHEERDAELQLDVGAVVLATGYDLYDPGAKSEYGYRRYPNVLSALEYERMLSASGPTLGDVKRPSDDAHPKKVAFIQCVGSRDQEHEYCSSVCCTFANKQAMLTIDHVPECEPEIFLMDMRAQGKGFDAFYQRALDMGVKFIRSRPSYIKEDPLSDDLLISWEDEDGGLHESRYDMVVLSAGLEPARKAQEAAGHLGIALNRHGFCELQEFDPLATSRKGVFVVGPFGEPKDIPDSVAQASAAAAKVMAGLADSRDTLTVDKQYPAERDVSGEEPRIGGFVCHCGSNIAGVIDVENVADYAKTLPGVAYATDNLYSCSSDSLTLIREKIEEHQLNRVVVASCTPRTHEPIFQDTLREAGLNPFLFEMANIRDQASWVHSQEHAKATDKARDLVRMSVARARMLEPLFKIDVPLTHAALVVGGGVAGMTAAGALGDMGHEVHLVERGNKLGGLVRELGETIKGNDPAVLIASLEQKLVDDPNVKIHLEAELADFHGFIGNFSSTIREKDGKRTPIDHGVVVVATGTREDRPELYGLGASPKVVTGLDLERMLKEDDPALADVKSAGFVLCAGSLDETHPYCSRTCCQQSIKNAIRLKEQDPRRPVYVWFKEIRTYGLLEEYYTKARELGVIFTRYDNDTPPQVNANGSVSVACRDPYLGRDVATTLDLLVLATPAVPAEGNTELSKLLKVPVTGDGFYLEAHVKLRPVDFSSEGIFLCGSAHYPKSIEETISQAYAAAGRAAAILAKPTLKAGGVVAEVDEEKCAACLTCVRICPYDVPVIDTESKKAKIEAAACQGCGVCVSECPVKAITLHHYTDAQIFAKEEALFMEVS